jgi:hypothetical protein
MIVYLDCSRKGRDIDVLHLARCLKEQEEVKELIAPEIAPERLAFTVILAACLPYLWSTRCSWQASHLTCLFSIDRGLIFLEIWEYFVYPILKDTNNVQWAERWRGGHIINTI